MRFRSVGLRFTDRPKVCLKLDEVRRASARVIISARPATVAVATDYHGSGSTNPLNTSKGVGLMFFQAITF